MNSTQIAAVGLVLLLVAVPIVATIIVIARSRLNLFQCCLWAVAYVLCKFLWRTRWLNAPSLPDNAGAIIVCNHRSSVDPFFVQTATGRKIHWMVAREYCEHPALRWFLSACEVIPVNRGGIDTAATKAAIRLASSGEIVGMLPEGRINMSEQFMLPVRPGAALVALRANVPMVPCYIRGAPYRRHAWSPFLMPARVEVSFGEPLTATPADAAEGEESDTAEFTKRTLQAIAALAGQANFQPQLAGRSWKPTDADIQQAIADKERREASGEP